MGEVRSVYLAAEDLDVPLLELPAVLAELAGLRRRLGSLQLQFLARLGEVVAAGEVERGAVWAELVGAGVAAGSELSEVAVLALRACGEGRKEG